MLRIKKEELEKLYIEEKKTINELAEIYGCRRQTMSNYLKKIGIEIVSSANRTYYRLSKELIYDLYVIQNLTEMEICNKLNTSPNTLCRLIKEYDLHKDGIIYQSDKRKSNKEILTKEFLENEYKTKSINAISEETGISARVLSNKMKEYGIELTDRATAAKKGFIYKYGVINPMYLDSSKEKMEQTNLEKYGCLYGIQTDNCKKSQKNIGSHSKPNYYFSNLLDKNNIEYEREVNIGKYIYDFKIGNVLIEINPTATHNITWNPFNKLIDKNYHLDKLKNANDNGYTCINIFDWDDQNKIINFFKQKQKIYARKCEIKNIESKELNDFLLKNHIQGTCMKQDIKLGLYYNNELVEVMTFGKPRYNRKYEYELLRLCTKAEYYIIGGTEKLFKYFIKTYNPESIISYCDKSKFSGDVYNRLGFKLIRSNKPSKHWYNMKTKQHITDNLLRQRGYDELFNASYGKGTSNDELMKNNGFVEVCDCGQSTYAYKKC